MSGSLRGSPENCQQSLKRDLALKITFSSDPNLMKPCWLLIMMAMTPVVLVTTLTSLLTLLMLTR